MNIKELKEIIANLPDDMDVMIEQTNDECRYGMAQVAEKRDVTFMEPESDDESTEWPVIECLVITDDFFS